MCEPGTQSLIHWAPHGQSFLVTNEYLFAQQVMRRHFKHTNFSSFVRQLNFYGFHKRATQGGATQFDHPSFRKGREELLHHIIRRSGGGGGGGGEKAAAGGGEGGAKGDKAKGDKAGESYRDEIKQLGEQVRQLKSQYADLAEVQKRILFVFGRYMSAGGRGDGANRKRYVSEGADDDGAQSGAGASAAKRARLLLEDRQSSEGHRAGPAAQAGGRERGGRGGRSFPNPLADIDWGDPHAMQDLIHSPYLRGAPQVLNNTPLPLELPPLQGRSTPSSAMRSPRPLLLSGREEEKGMGGRRLNVPPIEVGRRQHVGSGRGVFYDAGDSPSSQSSASTEAEPDRSGGQQPADSHHFADPFASAAPLTPHFDQQQWASSPHLASNGVIYCPPAQGGSGLGVGSLEAERGGWPSGGQVKVEGDFVPVSPSLFDYPLASSPPPLEPLPTSLPLPELDAALLHSALDTASSSSLLSPLPSSHGAHQPEPLSPLPFALSAPSSPLPPLPLFTNPSPMARYSHASHLHTPAINTATLTTTATSMTS